MRIAVSLACVWACLTLAACDKQPNGTSAASATASAAPPPAPTPSAAVAPPKQCPEGSTGSGSYEDPCRASGDSRLVRVEFDKRETGVIVFAATNEGPYTVIGGARTLRAYDDKGKQLDFMIGGEPIKYVRNSGRLSQFIPAGKTQNVEFFLSDLPAGATVLEVEFEKVEMATSGDTPDFVWENPDLAKAERPASGTKP